MSEGSLYDRELAALAIKQARGDLIEAIFLVRAYRTTLPRFGTSVPIDTGAMDIQRRISATFKDLPGGQVLGPTFDYTHRLLDHGLAGPPTAASSPLPAGGRPDRASDPGGGNGDAANAEALSPHPGLPSAVRPSPSREGWPEAGPPIETIPAENVAFPRVTDLLAHDDLIEPSPASDTPAGDLTRDPLSFPAARDLRLQNLARGDEGFLLALGYSTQRGYGRTHPFAGEIRFGEVEVEMFAEEVGFAVPLGRVAVSECQMINQFKGSGTEVPRFTRGYGLTFGQSERKVMAMALVDRALRARELGEEIKAPAQDEEFVLSHSDNVQATGFVEHLKLPHYVDFQSELGLVRRLREAFAKPENVSNVAEAAE